MARAEEKGIDLVEIESMDAQYQMMADYSEELQELLSGGYTTCGTCKPAVE
jgi:hypothetical protein